MQYDSRKQVMTTDDDETCQVGLGGSSSDTYFWERVMRIVKSRIYLYSLDDVEVEVLVHRR